jgi:hypothetical protein
LVSPFAVPAEETDMTPEERQAKIDFIIANQEEFAAQMDKLAADLTRNEQESKQVHQRFAESLVRQNEDIEVLKRLAQQFLRILQVEREVRIADHEAEARAREAERKAREAELQAERERQKNLEGRVDGIEEMTKFLRELLEGNLRPPDKPPETEN